MEDGEFKKCPFCKEQIRKEAVKCRFCGEWLEHNVEPPPVVKLNLPTTTQQEFPKPVENEVQAINQPTGKKKISPKTLFWINSGLLSGCGLFFLILVTRFNWSQLSPEDADKATNQLVVIITRTLACAGLVAWIVNRKGYRFLAFSVTCTIMTVVSVYYFQTGKLSAEQKQKETRSINHSLIQEIASTVIKMNQEIVVLQERDVFDKSLLTNKASLESEISKRIECRKIISDYGKNILFMITTAQQKSGSKSFFDKSFSQYHDIIELRSKGQKVELDFLQFLFNSFEDFRLKDGTISFSKTPNLDNFNNLSAKVQDAANEFDAYIEQNFKASKTSSQTISQQTK